MNQEIMLFNIHSLHIYSLCGHSFAYCFTGVLLWLALRKREISFESLKLCRWINLKCLEIILKLPISKCKLFCYSVCRYLLRCTQEEEVVVEDRWISEFNTAASATVGKTNTYKTYTIYSIWTDNKKLEKLS